MNTMTRKPYRTDLTDEQWRIIQPLIPPAKPAVKDPPFCYRQAA